MGERSSTGYYLQAQSWLSFNMRILLEGICMGSSRSGVAKQRKRILYRLPKVTIVTSFEYESNVHATHGIDLPNMV